MAAYDVSVNIVFLGEADFDDPSPLGTTDRTRYVKITTGEETQGPELQQWISGPHAGLKMEEGHAGQPALGACSRPGRRTANPSG